MGDLTLHSTCESETTKIGHDIAMVLKVGDFLCLSGELGTGKSVLARGIIRHLASDEHYEVPSPTYTLCQSYETNPPIAHFDLYRIAGGMDELEELGWSEMLHTGAVLMEWPEQCFDKIPDTAVHLQIHEQNDETREIVLSGNPEILARIKRSFLIRQFLDKSNLGDIKRSTLMGDASARSYELIKTADETLLLMNAPEMPDGPPIRDGKPYSKIANLAENVTAFVAIDELLRDKDFAAPHLKAQDLQQGFLLIEHFGNALIIDETRAPISERYLVAVEFLADLHENNFTANIKLQSGEEYQIPTYGHDAMMIEAELLLDWYAPSQRGSTIELEDRTAFSVIWGELAKKASEHEQSLVLRDYHSPNILWRETETGSQRIGVIDFQDAVLGPASYDVASLAQDARVDVSEALEDQLVNHYIKQRKHKNANFDENAFRESYAIMAAQRATKILGIFIRLNERDGKPAYLQHLPRMQGYIERSLKHSILAEYKAWLDRVIKL